MVGCATFSTATHDLPATRFLLVVICSGPGTGCASDTVPGQIGNCVCPGDGCQRFVCARRPLNANEAARAKTTYFITALTMIRWGGLSISIVCGKERPRKAILGARIEFAEETNSFGKFFRRRY